MSFNKAALDSLMDEGGMTPEAYTALASGNTNLDSLMDEGALAPETFSRLKAEPTAKVPETAPSPAPERVGSQVRGSLPQQNPNARRLAEIKAQQDKAAAVVEPARAALHAALVQAQGKGTIGVAKALFDLQERLKELGQAAPPEWVDEYVGRMNELGYDAPIEQTPDGKYRTSKNTIKAQLISRQEVLRNYLVGGAANRPVSTALGAMNAGTRAVNAALQGSESDLADAERYALDENKLPADYPAIARLWVDFSNRFVSDPLTLIGGLPEAVLKTLSAAPKAVQAAFTAAKSTKNAKAAGLVVEWLDSKLGTLAREGYRAGARQVANRSVTEIPPSVTATMTGPRAKQDLLRRAEGVMSVEGKPIPSRMTQEVEPLINPPEGTPYQRASSNAGEQAALALRSGATVDLSPSLENFAAKLSGDPIWLREGDAPASQDLIDLLFAKPSIRSAPEWAPVVTQLRQAERDGKLVIELKKNAEGVTLPQQWLQKDLKDLPVSVGPVTLDPRKNVDGWADAFAEDVISNISASPEPGEAARRLGELLATKGATPADVEAGKRLMKMADVVQGPVPQGNVLFQGPLQPRTTRAVDLATSDMARAAVKRMVAATLEKNIPERASQLYSTTATADAAKDIMNNVDATPAFNTSTNQPTNTRAMKEFRGELKTGRNESIRAAMLKQIEAGDYASVEEALKGSIQPGALEMAPDPTSVLDDALDKFGKDWSNLESRRKRLRRLLGANKTPTSEAEVEDVANKLAALTGTIINDTKRAVIEDVPGYIKLREMDKTLGTDISKDVKAAWTLRKYAPEGAPALGTAESGLTAVARGEKMGMSDVKWAGPLTNWQTFWGKKGWIKPGIVAGARGAKTLLNTLKPGTGISLRSADQFVSLLERLTETAPLTSANPAGAWNKAVQWSGRDGGFKGPADVIVTLLASPARFPQNSSIRSLIPGARQMAKAIYADMSEGDKKQLFSAEQRTQLDREMIGGASEGEIPPAEEITGWDIKGRPASEAMKKDASKALALLDNEDVSSNLGITREQASGLMQALIAQEGGEKTGKHNVAESSAAGPFGLIDSTFKGGINLLRKAGADLESFGSSSTDRDANLAAGVAALGESMKRYGGDIKKVIAAHRVGPDVLQKRIDEVGEENWDKGEWWIEDGESKTPMEINLKYISPAYAKYLRATTWSMENAPAKAGVAVSDAKDRAKAGLAGLVGGLTQ